MPLNEILDGIGSGERREGLLRTLVLLTDIAEVDLCYFQAEIDNLLLICYLLI